MGHLGPLVTSQYLFEVTLVTFIPLIPWLQDIGMFFKSSPYSADCPSVTPHNTL